MRKKIEIKTVDDKKLVGYIWEKDDPRAVVVIVHGLAEYCLRYNEFANFLNNEGFAVLSADMRGHGETAQNGVLGHVADRKGYELVTYDIKSMVERSKLEYPGVPVVIFVHSAGATFGKAAMIKFGESFDACIISGDTLNKPGLREIGPAFSLFLSWFGKRKPSEILTEMTFGEYNKSFQPAKTKFDWLSRDEEEVEKYIKDDLCGFAASPMTYRDIAKTILFSLKKKNIEKIPKNMKIFMITGGKDPCGSDGKDIILLYSKYKKAGLDVKYKIYPGARHELLNETNREEVMNDILNFLEKAIA